jgi:hypothetical protein
MKKYTFKGILFCCIVACSIISCSSIEKGIVISKRVNPPQNIRSVKIIGKMMIPSSTHVAKQFVIVILSKEHEKSIAIDSLAYTKIQVKDSVCLKDRTIIKHW